MLGAWAVSGDPKYVITLRQALAERLGDKAGGRLLYAQGCDLLSGEDANVLHGIDAHGQAVSDVQLPIPDDARDHRRGGGDGKESRCGHPGPGRGTNWMEGEAASRVHLGFTGEQEQLLEAVAATGKPVILVVLAARPLELKWAADHVPAILEAWSPGIEAGHAVADVLFGDVNPSGKLPVQLSTGRWPGAALLRATANGPAGAWRPEPDAVKSRNEVYVEIYR